MTYCIIDDLAIGSVPLSIMDIVQYLPEYFDGLAMLLARADGSPAAQVLAEDFVADKLKLGDAVLFAIEEVEETTEEGWPFDGFEELYLLRQEHADTRIPRLDLDPAFTIHDFAEQVPPEFIERFRAVKAVRYLSDGCGLNFACEPYMADKLQELDRTLAPGDPAGAMEDEHGTQRRAYVLPIEGPPNTAISAVRPRRPGGRSRKPET